MEEKWTSRTCAPSAPSPRAGASGVPGTMPRSGRGLDRERTDRGRRVQPPPPGHPARRRAGDAGRHDAGRSQRPPAAQGQGSAVPCPRRRRPVRPGAQCPHHRDGRAGVPPRHRAQHPCSRAARRRSSARRWRAAIFPRPFVERHLPELGAARIVKPVLEQATWLAVGTQRPATLAARTVARLVRQILSS